ncbi:MAG: hypothetical protein GY913_26115 [Proteobacteria bacterium]|nr:hypothetical protein [Pseudomonadota bacterium]MCP4920392.1 hypothetical protein [Pseudomonadota bacterium]
MTLFSILISLAACTKDGENTDSGDEWVDADSDGYSAEEDCNDDDAAVNPAADEICDDIDNDCDDEIDEDPVDGSSYYTDADGDSYGDAATEQLLCTQPADTVENGDDCDDTSADNNPAALEYCDGVDNDCDGDIDEADAEDALTFYADTDSDGYGDAAVTEVACEASTGFVSDDTDCDDAEANANPGLTEVCSDGIDNDCDGTENECLATGGSLADFDVILRGANEGDQLGTPVRGLGDGDGDGANDLAVSARGYDDGDNSGAGRVYFVSGPLSAGSYGIDDVATGSITGEADGDALFGVWPVGDADGDGASDVVVSAKTNDTIGNNAGRIYVFGAMPAGDVSAADADAIYDAEAEGDQAGVISFGGDLTGSGSFDLLVSATNNDQNGSNSGAVYIIEAPFAGGDLADEKALVVYGPNEGDKAGGGLSAAGDVDGDGVDDFLVGVPYADKSDDEGAVAVFLGGTHTGMVSSTDADFYYWGNEENGEAGWGLSRAGDQDGDGLDDILASARKETVGANSAAGVVYLVPGSTADGALGDVASASFEGAAADDKISNNDGSGDLNGDGNNDIVIGSNAADDPGDAAGAAYLFYGPTTGSWSVTSADAVWTGEAAGDAAGAPVNFGADVNGDGLDDLLVGALKNDGAAEDAGAAYILFGSGL